MIKTPKTGAEPAHLLRRREQPLDVFFSPSSVAVIGATENTGSVGRTLLTNLLATPFGGTVYPVNPKRKSVLGIKAFASIGEVPDQVDLAVVVTPAPSVPAIIGQCVEAGVRGAVIISAGFKEIGGQGAELERQILTEARRGNMRIVGPNCLGVMCPPTGLNATFATTLARPGTVGFISQSGALLTAILDWSLREAVGFSAFVSTGSMLDVGWGDLIDYLGDDPRTRSIVIYMESIGDARAFLSAARAVALNKPIIVIKAGRSEAAAKAAASHTGSLAGSDDVLEAAFRRCGVLRVHRIADVFYMAEVLGKQPGPRGPRLTILTNAGGPGVLATDALIAEGGELATLAPRTIQALNQLLPPHWSHSNPIDILGDAGPERYAKAVECAAQDPNSDGLLVVLTPQAMTDPTQTAEQLKPFAKLNGKPILASWMGGAEIAAGEAILARAGIPTFPYPDSAARAFHYMWRYSDSLRALYETPVLPADQECSPAREVAQRLIEGARRAGRTILTEAESKELLAAYCLPTVETHVARSEEEAVQIAGRLGYPVVLKLHSETITHKTDVGGVQLDIRNADAVRLAWRAIESSVLEKAGPGHLLGATVQRMISRGDSYELIIGSSIDAQFGPVLLFGAGGPLVEILQDRALGLPPLNSTLARRLMERTQIFRALQGVRGRRPVDLDALEMLLVRFSRLVIEQPCIAEIDINPLLASPDCLLALDARVLLHGPEVAAPPQPAIRPYPQEYVGEWTMRDGQPVSIRPIRPEDEPLMVHFHLTLSEESIHMRFFRAMNLDQRIAHERLTRICFIDYEREMALVAERSDAASGDRQIIAVARLIKSRDRSQAECALLVSDPFHGKGLGSEILRRLLEVARAEAVHRISADILPENHTMHHILERLGFEVRYDVDEQLVKAQIML
jgi:acetyltransferase